MFANNGQISWKQMMYQMSLGFLGPMILFLPGRGGLTGIAGCISCITAGIVLTVYAVGLVRMAPLYSHPEKYIGSAGCKAAGGIYLLYFIWTGAFLVDLTGKIVSMYLVTGISDWVLHGMLVLACALAGVPQIQRRGRLAEFCFPFCFGAFGLMVILAFVQNRGDFVVNLMQETEMDIDILIKDTYTILAAGIGISAAPFILGDVKDHRYRSLVHAWAVILLSLGAVVLLIRGSYGMEQTMARQWPALSVMAGIRGPKGFVFRLDPIWLSLFMVFMLFSIGTAFFYGNYITERMQLHIPRYVVYGSVFVLSLAELRNGGVGVCYMPAVKLIFAPLLLLLSLFMGIKYRRYGR